ncbi:unnamed protein product [Prorocentrum cordatum]|uniref:Uncharacterized protein n=1 Tax=Prorocentrum cordatum TaxID=2364126 RepID=A0ABN9XB81_9DINO|nr:unnamed protein product [Polarella glacialis]
MSGSADHVAQKVAFAAVLEAIIAVPMRRALQEHLLRQAVATASTVAMGGGGVLMKGKKAPGSTDAVLSEFEAVLQGAGEALGLERKATSEDVRHALRAIGEESLAKDWAGFRAGRRALAHPKPGLTNSVMSKLVRGHANSHSESDTTAEAPLTQAPEASTDDFSDFGEKVSKLERVCEQLLKHHSDNEAVHAKLVAKYALVDYCYNMRNTMQDLKLQDKFEANDLDAIGKAVQDTLQWSDKPLVADAAEFEGKRRELEGIVNPIMIKAVESCCYNMRGTLQDLKLQDKFESRDLDNIEEAVNDTLHWLHLPQAANVAALVGKHRELEGIANPIFDKVRKAQTKQKELEGIANPVAVHVSQTSGCADTSASVVVAQAGAVSDPDADERRECMDIISNSWLAPRCEATRATLLEKDIHELRNIAYTSQNKPF